MYYNSTKGGVDVCDIIIAHYTCDTAVRRWPTRMLFFMLGVACLNAHQLFIMRHRYAPGRTGAFCARAGVGNQLLAEQAERRAQQYTAGAGIINRQTSDRWSWCWTAS